MMVVRSVTVEVSVAVFVMVFVTVAVSVLVAVARMVRGTCWRRRLARIRWLVWLAETYCD